MVRPVNATASGTFGVSRLARGTIISRIAATAAAVDAEAKIKAQAGAVSSQAWEVPASCRAAKDQDHAVVTLITSNEGYPAGALAISAALEVLEAEADGALKVNAPGQT